MDGHYRGGRGAGVQHRAAQGPGAGQQGNDDGAAGADCGAGHSQLHPLRREYLFSKSDNVIPGTYGYNGLAAHIIRNYLDGCAFSEKYTLEACNKRLIEIKAKPLTKLTSITEGSK